MYRFLLPLVFTLTALGQLPPPTLKAPPAGATLGQMVKTLALYASTPETDDAIAGIRTSATWLAGNLKDDRTPEDYARNLEQDLELLRQGLRSSSALQAATLRSVLEDMQLKHADCRKWGMGRLVKLEVRTVKDKGEVGGWQVYYRWLPSRAVGEVRPQPFLSLSSPTSVELPPGAYSVQARKTVGGKEVATAELPVPVAGLRTVTFEVPVP